MFDQYQIVAIAIAMISVILSILLYQISKIFNLPGLKRYSEMMVWEALLTILLALFLFIILDKINSFLYDLSVSMFKTINIDVSNVQPKAPVTAAREVLRILISDCYLNMYGSYLMARAILESIGKAISEIGAENTKLPTSQAIYSVIWMKDLIKLFHFMIWTGMVMLKMMVFFSAYYPVLIMLGIILRAFEPTKSMGAYLISLGIGLYVVFPTGYNLGLVINYNKVLCTLPEQIKNSTEVTTGFYNLFEIGENAKSFVGVTTMIKTLTDFTLGLIVAPHKVVELIYAVTAVTLITPLIAFIVTLSFVNISTTALGGRISEIGRGLFKLI